MAPPTLPSVCWIQFPLNIEGLDLLLRGGLACPPLDHDGLILLLKGAPGTGKTTLALQIALGATRWNTNTGQIIEIFNNEQPKGDIVRTLHRLCGRNDAHASDKKYHIDPKLIWGRGPVVTNGTTNMDDSQSSLNWARELVVTLREGEEDTRSHRLIIVDGLNLVMSSERDLLEAEKVMDVLRKRAQVGIVIFEPGEGNTESVEFYADVIIELIGKVTKEEPEYFMQHLNIRKSRFQPSVLGWHQYKIGDTGLQVFPSIHYRMHAGEDKVNGLKLSGRPSIVEGYKKSLRPIRLSISERKTSTKSNEPDGSILGHILGPEAMMGGNFTIVLGPRRAWKTLLTFDWLRAGSRANEVCLLASLMENENTISRQRRKLCEYYCPNEEDGWPDCKSDKCYQNIYLYSFRPGCVAPGEFLHYLCKSVEETRKPNSGKKQGFTRFLFWDLMQLEHRFPLLANDPLFVPGLIDYLKHVRQIPSVFMGAPNTRFARTASAIADNVVFCWQDTRVNDKIDGWCFYVDRIEGQPEHGRLHFVKAFVDVQSNTRHPAHTAEELVEKKTERDEATEYLYATAWIEAIREMQGLALGIGPDARKASGWVHDDKISDL